MFIRDLDVKPAFDCILQPCKFGSKACLEAMPKGEPVLGSWRITNHGRHPATLYHSLRDTETGIAISWTLTTGVFLSVTDDWYAKYCSSGDKIMKSYSVGMFIHSPKPICEDESEVYYDMDCSVLNGECFYHHFGVYDELVEHQYDLDFIYQFMQQELELFYETHSKLKFRIDS